MTEPTDNTRPKQQTKTTDAQTDEEQPEKPLRYELAIEPSRWPLDHPNDDVDVYRDLLAKGRGLGRPGAGLSKADLDYTLEGFDPETGRALVIVETEHIRDRPPLVDHLESAMRSAVRHGYHSGTEGEEKPRYQRLAKMRALRGEDQPRGVSKKDRERAERWAEGRSPLDFEDAPPLTVEVSIRTLAGAPAPFDIPGGDEFDRRMSRL